MTTKEINLAGNNLPIREFKLDWMVPNPSIVMIAKRGSGKSWVVRSILKHYNDLPGGVIISKTDKMNPFYGKFFPELYIHYEYSSELLQRILYRQGEMCKKAEKKRVEGKRVDPRAFLVMDDCLSSKGQWMKDEHILEVFFNGRHYKLMYILTMQFPLGITPELRCNFDYIFLLAEDFVSNKKRLYDHYAGMFPNFDSFKQVFDEITSDYGCMVIVNRGSRKNFLDKVFWYKAGNDKIRRMGCRQFNDFHDDNYDPKWKDRDGNKPFDIGTYVNTRKKTKIVVNKVADEELTK